MQRIHISIIPPFDLCVFYSMIHVLVRKYEAGTAVAEWRSGG